MTRYLDTNILVRAWEGQEKALTLLHSVAEGLEVSIPATVCLELYHVLTKVLRCPKTEAAEFLGAILNIPHTKVAYQHSISYALALHTQSNLKFPDCLVASYLQPKDILYSFDKDFDKVPHILREQP